MTNIAFLTTEGGAHARGLAHGVAGEVLVVRAQLEAQGWRVLVVWECETKRMPLLAGKIADFLKPAPVPAFRNVG